jgi:hypothetical protein
MRALSNRDIATGTISTTGDQTYSSTGTSSTWQYKNDIPDSPAPTCYVRALLASCTEDQIMAVVNGTALVRDWIVIDNNTATLSNSSSISSYGNTFEDRASSLRSIFDGGRLGDGGIDAIGGGGTLLSRTAGLTGKGSELDVRLGPLASVLAIGVAILLH